MAESWKESLVTLAIAASMQGEQQTPLSDRDDGGAAKKQGIAQNRAKEFQLSERYKNVLLSKDAEVLDKALFDAVKGDDLDGAQYLLNKKADLNKIWRSKNVIGQETIQTALGVAIENDNTAMVKWLLDSKADPNQAVDAAARTPIMLPANAEIAKLLLEAGAELSKTATGENNALHMIQPDAHAKERIKVFQLYGKDFAKALVAQNSESYLPVEQFIKSVGESGHITKRAIDIAAQLMPHPDVRKNHYALRYALNNIHLLRLMLDNGYYPHMADFPGGDHEQERQPVLHIIAQTGMNGNPLQCAEAIINSAEIIDKNYIIRFDENLRTPLFVAFQSGNYAFAEYILSKISQRGDYYVKEFLPGILGYAEKSSISEKNTLRENLASTRLQLRRDDPMQGFKQQKITQLQDKLALIEIQEKILELALAVRDRKFMPANRANEEKIIPLEDDVVAEPVENKEAPESKQKYKNVVFDALYQAVRAGEINTFEKLLAEGANVQSRYKSDHTTDNVSLLHVAAQYGHTEIMARLIKKGVSVNTRDGLDQTPLHYAAEFGNAESLAALLAAGANPDSISSLGQNALHYAVQSNDFEIVKTMLKTPVNLEQINSFGQTPFDMATTRLKAGDTHSAVIAGAISAAMNRRDGVDKPKIQR